MQVPHNLLVSKTPWLKTTVIRLSARRSACVLNVEKLLHALVSQQMP